MGPTLGIRHSHSLYFPSPSIVSLYSLSCILLTITIVFFYISSMGTEDNKICASISPRGGRPEEDVQWMRGGMHLVETLRHSLLCAWCNSVRVSSLKPVWSPLLHATGLDPLSKGSMNPIFVPDFFPVWLAGS